MENVAPLGAKNYVYLQTVRGIKHIQIYTDVLKCFNNEGVVPPLKTRQKTIEFDHNKGIDMLKFGYKRPILANICFHKSTDSKFCLFTETAEDLLEKL